MLKRESHDVRGKKDKIVGRLFIYAPPACKKQYFDYEQQWNLDGKYYDGNHVEYWSKLMKLSWLISDPYSLKNCNNPFSHKINPLNHPPRRCVGNAQKYVFFLRGAYLTALCGYPLLKFPEENFFLRPHFLEIQLFQTEYLGIVFCPVSLLIYFWGLVEYGQLEMGNLQQNQLQFR